MLPEDNQEERGVMDTLVMVPQIVPEIILFKLLLVSVEMEVMAEHLLRQRLQADGELHPQAIGVAMAD
jgi:hypothetical protein